MDHGVKRTLVVARPRVLRSIRSVLLSLLFIALSFSQPDDTEARSNLIRSSFRNSRQDAQAEQTRVNNVLWMVMHHRGRRYPGRAVLDHQHAGNQLQRQ